MARGFSLFALLTLLLAAACQAGKLWGVDVDKNKKEREEKTLAREGGGDALSSDVQRRLQESAGLGMEDLALGLATGDIDFKVLAGDFLDYYINFAEDPATRAALPDPAALKEVMATFAQQAMPAMGGAGMGMGMDDISAAMEQMLASSLNVPSLSDLDPAEFKRHMGEFLDKSVAKAKEAKAALADSDKLRAFTDATLEELGLPEEQRIQIIKVLSDPMALYESWKTMADTFQQSMDDPAGTLQSLGITQEMFQQQYEEMLKDPSMAALLNDPAMQELVNDPEKWQEMMALMAGGDGVAGEALGGAGRLPRRGGGRPLGFQEQLNAARRA